MSTASRPRDQHDSARDAARPDRVVTVSVNDPVAAEHGPVAIAGAAAPVNGPASPTGSATMNRAAADADSDHPGFVALAMDLTKARLSLLVLWTTATGAMLAAHWAAERTGASLNVPRLLWTLIGTALAAGSAGAFNQALEHRRDSVMRRTRRRPVPAGHLSPAAALGIALGLGTLGVGLLLAFVGTLAAGLAALTIVMYAAMYTPMKPRTTLNTFVGAIVGAIPPMIGWASVTGGLEAGAWALFALLFVWQIPHFLALAWMYREDYATGGFHMLPASDPTGRLTAQATLAGCLLLVPVALSITLVGVGGWIYSAGSILLAVWMSARALRFVRERTDEAARSVFLASLLYLTVVLILAVADPTEMVHPIEVAQPGGGSAMMGS
ncbi:MAG: heme o synthase [Phycisphaerales bacterium]